MDCCKGKFVVNSIFDVFSRFLHSKKLQNAPGSFALFGGNAAAKSYMGVGEDGQRATWAQDALSSAAGAIASITVAQPLDVIKVSHPCEYILYII